MTSIMKDTGERMVPEKTDGVTFWEHIERYRFASKRSVGKRVLDIASGEGYGSAALLEAGAASVIGVDIDQQACAHAARKYGIEARAGSGEAIPLETGSVDLVVSFETIEHINDPSRFVAEILRVLVPGGTLIISTPDKDHYNLPKSQPNPYHCSELTEKEFKELMEPHFSKVAYYGQGPTSAAWWSPTALIARESPWARVRGLARVRRRVLRWSDEQKNCDVPESVRANPVQSILNDRRSRAIRALDWFAVRRFPRIGGWSPVYWIAVGQKPK